MLRVKPKKKGLQVIILLVDNHIIAVITAFCYTKKNTSQTMMNWNMFNNASKVFGIAHS